MRICLWDAGGFSGIVCDRDPERATRRALAVAASCIADGGKARVELVRLVMTSGDLQPDYVPVGVCWTGQLCAGRVVWTRAADALGAAA